MEDLRGIEGLFEELMKEADEATQFQVKYKELGSTSEYRLIMFRNYKVHVFEEGHKFENKSFTYIWLLLSLLGISKRYYSTWKYSVFSLEFFPFPS